MLALISVSACSESRSCTEAGCLSFVRVGIAFASELTADDVEVVVEHDGQSFACDFGATSDPCHEGFDPGPSSASEAASERFAVLLDDTPRLLQITVTSGDKSETQIIRPEYERRQPNGPDCPPICLASSSRLEFGL